MNQIHYKNALILGLAFMASTQAYGFDHVTQLARNAVSSTASWFVNTRVVPLPFTDSRASLAQTAVGSATVLGAGATYRWVLPENWKQRVRTVAKWVGIPTLVCAIGCGYYRNEIMDYLKKHMFTKDDATKAFGENHQRHDQTQAQLTEQHTIAMNGIIEAATAAHNARQAALAAADGVTAARGDISALRTSQKQQHADTTATLAAHGTSIGAAATAAGAAQQSADAAAQAAREAGAKAGAAASAVSDLATATAAFRASVSGTLATHGQTLQANGVALHNIEQRLQNVTTRQDLDRLESEFTRLLAQQEKVHAARYAAGALAVHALGHQVHTLDNRSRNTDRNAAAAAQGIAILLSRSVGADSATPQQKPNNGSAGSATFLNFKPTGSRQHLSAALTSSVTQTDYQ